MESDSFVISLVEDQMGWLACSVSGDETVAYRPCMIALTLHKGAGRCLVGRIHKRKGGSI